MRVLSLFCLSLMPEKRLLDPKLDLNFKRQFAEHTDWLADLINAVRCDEPPVVGLEVRNPQVIPEEFQEKHIVLDVLAVDANGQQFNLEMQTSKHAGWSARGVYYMARTLGGQLQAGEGYDKIQPVVGIHLMDFDLFKEPDQAIWEFELRNRKYPDVVVNRSLQLNLVELPKAERLHPTVNPILAQWIIYFRHWHEETIMRQIQHPPIQKAYQHLQALSGDEQARREAFVRERALRDAVTMESAAKAEGMAEGIAIGETKGLSSLLMRQLRVKFGALSPATEQRLKSATPLQLEHWGDRVLTAETLEQVFASH